MAAIDVAAANVNAWTDLLWRMVRRLELAQTAMAAKRSTTTVDLRGIRPRRAMANSKLTNAVGCRPPHLKVRQTQEVLAEAIRLMLHRIPFTVAKMKRSVCSRHTWRHSDGPKL